MRNLGTALLVLAGGLAVLYGPGMPLGAVIFRLAPAFLNTLQAGVQRRLAPLLWDSLLLPVLEAPVWAVPAVFGAALVLAAMLCRARR